MGPRNFAFTDVGTSLAWSAAPSLLRSGAELADHPDPEISRQWLFYALNRARYNSEHLKDRLGIDTEYTRQGTRYYTTMQTFVRDYLCHYYPTPEAAASDPELRAFLIHAFTSFDIISPARLATATGRSQEFDPEALTASVFWTLLVDMVTLYCFQVNVYTYKHVRMYDTCIYASRWRLDSRPSLSSHPNNLVPTHPLLLPGDGRTRAGWHCACLRSGRLLLCLPVAQRGNVRDEAHCHHSGNADGLHVHADADVDG